MKLKIGFIFASSLLLIIALLNVPLIFAQFELWDSVQVSAYGIDVEESTGTFTNFAFTVAAPPQGSEILNVLNVSRVSGENYTRNLMSKDHISRAFNVFSKSVKGPWVITIIVADIASAYAAGTHLNENSRIRNAGHRNSFYMEGLRLFQDY